MNKIHWKFNPCPKCNSEIIEMYNHKKEINALLCKKCSFFCMIPERSIRQEGNQYFLHNAEGEIVGKGIN